MQIIDSYNLRETDKKITLTYYVADMKKNKKKLLEPTIIDFSIETGETILTHKNHIVNISYGIPKNFPSKIRRLFTAVKTKPDIDHPMWEFLEHCFKKRNIQFTTPRSLEIANTDHVFSSALIFLRFPVLECLPFHSIISVSKNMREEIDTCQNGRDIWKALTGHSSKKVRKWCDTKIKFNQLMRFGKHLTNIDALLLFLNSIERLKDVSYLRVGSHEAKNDEFTESELIDFGKTLFPSEYEFITQLMKVKENGYSYYSIGAFSLLADIKRMVREILYLDADVKIPKIQNLNRLHDELVILLRSTKHKNVIIHYTDSELERELIHKDYSICLVKDTHELHAIGTRMKHCVYSYKDMVLKKRCYIFILRDNHKNPLVCMEVRNNSLVQAKSFCNSLPKLEEVDKIKSWANIRSLVLDTYDIRSFAS